MAQPHGSQPSNPLPSQDGTADHEIHSYPASGDQNHEDWSEAQEGEPRSEHFDRGTEPFRYDKRLQLQDDKVTGPIWFMNPTRAIYSYSAGSLHPDPDASGVEYKWTSRNSRKGRHALIIREEDERTSPYATPKSTGRPRPILQGIWRMFTVFTYRDVSYLLAVAFTAACTILTVNAVLSLIPFTQHLKSSDTLYRVEAVLGAVGSTLFFSGGLISFSEAVNVNRRGCFGWKLTAITDAETNRKHSLADNANGNVTVLVPDGSCAHHHDSYKVVDGQPPDWHRPYHRQAKTSQRWIWLPSFHELSRHLIYDFGFVTATMLSLSSALYCAMAWGALVTTFSVGQVALWIRIPQMIAAAGFVASCMLAAIETQQRWWRPSFGVVGWHANFWNVAGSVGFLLTAVFGYVEMQDAEFQYGCSYLWGSLAFLVGSLLQWYEALDKYPVERQPAAS